ncbi:MAG: 2Fe-2S iron-sulfur cluster-binding protein [Gemmatimonadota bacterium]|nr:(2Fe-2S)-binding protein [Gemmatimonadota bacterium]
MSDNGTTETVTLTIDGREVSVPKGTTLLEAAQSMGTTVPHYCYHPGLSSPAMCRLCLVEVEGAPKLQPSCVTQAMPGQVVHTHSDKSLDMRRGVLEFYLVNHPLDCPICDQSGECKLQDYVNKEGRGHGRSREPKRIFGRDDFGGDVLFYGDRCVMCTRCVRFMDEVHRDTRLTVVERGGRSVIDTFFERGLEGAAFAGNIVDICPVGALVSKDFLHKARAWDLDHTPSVCPNCSQGCNIELHTRDNLVQRLKPRENPQVNSFWMCDYGRLRYEWINHADRLEVPRVRRGTGLVATDWSDALGALYERVAAGNGGPVTLIASPLASNEDLAALRRFGETLGGASTRVYRSRRTAEEIPLPGFPALVRRGQLTPNERGADVLGFTRTGDDDGKGGLEAIRGGTVVILGDPLVDLPPGQLEGADLVLYLGWYPSGVEAAADFVLPICTFAEMDGTFTNHEGRVQRFHKGLDEPGAARPAWFVLGAVEAALGDTESPARVDLAFERAGQVAPEFRGLTYLEIGDRGALLNEPIELARG